MQFNQRALVVTGVVILATYNYIAETGYTNFTTATNYTVNNISHYFPYS